RASRAPDLRRWASPCLRRCVCAAPWWEPDVCKTHANGGHWNKGIPTPERGVAPHITAGGGRYNEPHGGPPGPRCRALGRVRDPAQTRRKPRIFRLVLTFLEGIVLVLAGLVRVLEPHHRPFRVALVEADEAAGAAAEREGGEAEAQDRLCHEFPPGGLVKGPAC